MPLKKTQKAGNITSSCFFFLFLQRKIGTWGSWNKVGACVCWEDGSFQSAAASRFKGCKVYISSCYMFERLDAPSQFQTLLQIRSPIVFLGARHLPRSPRTRKYVFAEMLMLKLGIIPSKGELQSFLLPYISLGFYPMPTEVDFMELKTRSSKRVFFFPARATWLGWFGPVLVV